MVKFSLKIILYIEGLRDYLRVKLLVIRSSLIKRSVILEQKLPETTFFIVHRSFITALDRVTSFCANSVHIDKLEIPIGKKLQK